MNPPGGESATDDLQPAPHFTAHIIPGEAAFAVARGQPLLQAAALAGIELPSSCRNGTCRACICRLLSGRVSYRIEWPGLLPEEKAQGWILPCVACLESDAVLSWPAHQ